MQFNKSSRVTAQHAALPMWATGTPAMGGGSGLLHSEVLGAAEGWVLTVLRIALWCLPLFFKPKLVALSDSERLLCLPFIYLLLSSFLAFMFVKKHLKFNTSMLKKTRQQGKKPSRLFAQPQGS